MSQRAEEKLFDLRLKNYPNQRGDQFRSLQVFECPICFASTNAIIIGGWPGFGVRAICPNAADCWHHEIEEKVCWLQKPHPRNYKRELEKEIVKLRLKNASKIKSDLAGCPDHSQVRGITNTWARKLDGFCQHNYP